MVYIINNFNVLFMNMVIMQFDFKLALSFRNQFIAQQVFYSDKDV